MVEALRGRAPLRTRQLVEVKITPRALRKAGVIPGFATLPFNVLKWFILPGS